MSAKSMTFLVPPLLLDNTLTDLDHANLRFPDV